MICKEQNDIQVHHRRGVKSWAVKDLVTLCRKHHMMEHKKLRVDDCQMESRMRGNSHVRFGERSE
ncbi:hypothetical protein VCRA2121O391_390001 [Vibrio crassostreae]|nr:hypothetical protein VCRA2113O324_390001 [Vibrio crassostreae]CAK2108687.1 hypothetical protein VCRA2117O378_420001 [Vibrio crassostreae]CAK2913612.1 hypothetical protein VCRA2121O391_390001 [Vibrio crassostreae]CAK3424779.1 hypothetical protein VCRA2125O79_270001 [Vibrio crassostreae]CAK3436462.1 hypothetical protein VCRA2127O399_330001 [Vibrio crassostreae]